MANVSVKLINRSVLFLIFYALWGFLFSHSVFSNPLYIYASFLGLGVIFTLIVIKTPVKTDGILLWLPYILYTSMGYFYYDNIEVAIYWYIAIILLLTANSINYSDYLPAKLITISGFVCVIGVLLQLTLKPLYYVIISVLFSAIDITTIQYWDFSNYGFAGFTYQIAMTAIILLYAECMWLYKHPYNPTNKFQKTLRWIVTIIFIISIFLTGKRMLSIIAIAAPYLAHVFSTGKKLKTILLLLLGSLILVIGYSYMESNASQYSDSAILGRFARTVIDQQNGEDITSGREDLSEAAFRLFYSSPILGIGCGRFIECSGEDSDVHNSYLQIMCEQGIVGLILFVIPLFVFLRKAISMAKKLSTTSDSGYMSISLFIQIAFIAYAFTGNVTVNTFGFLIYFYAIAMQVFLRKKYRI